MACIMSLMTGGERVRLMGSTEPVISMPGPSAGPVRDTSMAVGSRIWREGGREVR